MEVTFRPRHDLGDGPGRALEGMRALVVLRNERAQRGSKAARQQCSERRERSALSALSEAARQLRMVLR
jgi:hypothetical protein